jgi:hypothetical protein
VFGLVLQIAQAVKNSIKGKDVPQILFQKEGAAVWAIVGLWVVLTGVAMVVQYRYPTKSSEAEEELAEEEKILKARAKMKAKYSSGTRSSTKGWFRKAGIGSSMKGDRRRSGGYVEMESLMDDEDL